MKKIINNKVYDTDKARLLGRDGYSHPGDFHWWSEALYQKRTGEFFLHGEGGPMTKYSVSTGLNQWRGGEKLIPLDMDAAKSWVEEHLDADDYESIFGLPDDDASKVAVHMMLPAPLVAETRQRAIEDNRSMVSVVESAITEYLHPTITNAVLPGQARRYWYLIDDCTSSRSDCDEEKLAVTTQAEAIAEGERRWDALTDHDRQQRDAYWVCLAEEDEDGCIDYNTSCHAHYFK